MHRHGYIGRKMRLPKLKKHPAIVIAAFGSSTRAAGVLELFRARLAAEFPGEEVFWAYTSEIIRKRKDLPGLQETLAQVEAQGYRRAVVQPLHVFPGTEYQQLAETCEYFPGLRAFLGETLLHRWRFVRETLAVVQGEFLAPEEGLNLLALHGTPLAADPVNTVYMGVEQLVRDLYPNVAAAAIEGVPDRDAVFARLAREQAAKGCKRIRIIPLMYFAGMHAEEDLMGETESWRSALAGLGFSVDCPTFAQGNGVCFKGLGHYPEINEFFLDRLRRALTLAEHY